MYQGGASTSSKKKIAPSRSISQGAHGLHEEPEAAAGEWRGRRPARDGAYVGVVGIARNLACAASAEHLEKAHAWRPSTPCRLPGYPRAVERRQASALADRDVECGDVGVADERLRVGRDDVEVDGMVCDP